MIQTMMRECYSVIRSPIDEKMIGLL